MDKEPQHEKAEKTETAGLGIMRKSMKVMIGSAKKLRGSLDKNPKPLMEFFSLLNETKRDGAAIHITGIGRSLSIGRLFGELLLDKGYNATVLGRDYARPVEDGDVIIGISASGTTRSTVANVQECVSKQVKVIAVTASNRSALERLADTSIVLDWCGRKPLEQDNYVRSQIHGKRVPLTPMGTMFEITALLLLVGIAHTLDQDTPVAEYQSLTRDVILELEKIWDRVTRNEGLTRSVLYLKEKITKALEKENGCQMFMYGSGASHFIAIMIGMRIQHLGVRMRPHSALRFKKSGDLLLHLCCTGEDPLSIAHLKSAKKSGLDTVGLTQVPNSTIAEEATQAIYLTDRVSEPHNNSHVLNPIFDWAAAVLLDSIIAEVAYDVEIEEREMIIRHANVQ